MRAPENFAEKNHQKRVKNPRPFTATVEIEHFQYCHDSTNELLAQIH